MTERQPIETHTPGPWRWEGVHDDGSGPLALHADSAIVIEPFTDWSLEPGEGLDDWGLHVSEADKRLIAAAPSLYQALDRLVEHISHNDENGHWSCWEDARIALKLARGEN
jgi:hypothetical protein